MHLPSTHGLKPDCQYYPEVLAEYDAVITPTTIPASNIGLIVAHIGIWFDCVKKSNYM